ncbi:MAG: hypothetical protein A2W90_09680 [Bacteroidetes bacterium GWF2_42_66]|nr:MAG: hypothetical protein A2W89_01725 [Bacteroidetes bacterium GWE2_42_39]OFY43740.1 MAG: hypothetical protein A2W90_09680 [Bacteroidetes bacterium GWF2_42_66]HBL76284.1 hypothetical protein [Prolixibacteraceae bacterium]
MKQQYNQPYFFLNNLSTNMKQQYNQPHFLTKTLAGFPLLRKVPHNCWQTFPVWGNLPNFSGKFSPVGERAKNETVELSSAGESY